MKVIVVEDEKVLREGIAKLLIKLDSEIEIVGVAENGQEGYEQIEKNSPDLVITDIKMPVMDGLSMLEKSKENGLQYKIIVLSAYSEFEYAQKAIKFGVSEYLLKPISVMELKQALDNIKKQIELDKKPPKSHPLSLYSINHIFQSSILGNLEIGADMEKFLKDNYNISIKDEFVIFTAYMGSFYEKQIDPVKKRLTNAVQGRDDYKFTTIDMPQKNALVAVLYRISDKKKVERYFQYVVMQEMRTTISDTIVYGWIDVNNITQMKSLLQTLLGALHWNLSLGSDVVISYPKVLNVHSVPMSYPIQLENELRTEICSMDSNKLQSIFSSFKNYCKKAVYNPTEIKETFIRFCWSVINILKETNGISENINSQQMLTDIMSAVTWEELERPFQMLLDGVTENNVKNEKRNISLPVLKAQSMIHEFYKDGITLDEISLKLNLTSEYLGTQFKKEIGESFSSYIKNYRIKKVKRLLIGTDLKTYEIASLTGYADAKYMGKVFKETTGYLPTEYRKIYK